MNLSIRYDVELRALSPYQGMRAAKKPSQQWGGFLCFHTQGGIGMPSSEKPSTQANARNQASNTQMGRHTSLVRVSCQGVVVLGVRHLEMPLSHQTAGVGPDGKNGTAAVPSAQTIKNLNSGHCLALHPGRLRNQKGQDREAQSGSLIIYR